MGGLIDVECPHCQGEGYLLWTGNPGDYSQAEVTFLPSEGFAICPECDGEGGLEVCSSCLTPCVVRGGQESCACPAAELPRAA